MPNLSALLMLGLCYLLATQHHTTVPERTAPPTEDRSFCATDALHNDLLTTDTTYRQRHAALEKAAYAYQRQHPQKSLPPPYTIPVVFHIIHGTGPENISDASVQQSLDYLNQAFANTDYYDQSTGVATGIQFCLAQRTPDNQATTGINRVFSPFTDVEAPLEDLNLKNEIRWDPTQYVNIWIVKEICGLGLGCAVAGYAYYPSAHGGNRDGIVVEARWLGTTPASSSVLVHEMGHYLGLYHTFEGGCTNDDCLADGDRVCDTPPDQSTAAVPCSGTANTCSTDTNSGFATDQDDMFNNYMDYGYWACYNAFTAGQRDRMLFFLEGIRASLLTSPGCLDPCPAPITAAFSGGNATVPIGTSLAFSNQSVNGESYDWRIDGTTFSTTFDAGYTFSALGTYEIVLTVSSTDPLCQNQTARQTVTVICPVESAFSGPLAVVPGDMATYTQQATQATTYTWTVDGAVVGTGPTLDYLFVAPGLHQVCLRAGNGLCEAELCRNVIVTNPANNCNANTFYRYLGNPDQNETGELLVPIPGGGGMYIGGHTSQAVLLLGLDLSGAIELQRAIYVPGGRVEGFTDCIADTDGMIYGTGYQMMNNDQRAFVFSYDPVADVMPWFHTLASNTRAWSLLPDVDPDHLLWVINSNGTSATGTGEDAGFLRLDKSTGEATGTLNQLYNLAGNEVFQATELYNDTYYCIGRYTAGAGTGTTRAAFSAFDTDGNELFSTLFHVPGTQTARLYGRDLVIENQSWTGIYSGDDNGTSTTATQTFLAQGTLAGAITRLVKYDIIEYGNEETEELVSVPDGFLLYGTNRSGDAELFLIKTDKQGTVLWAKGYGGADAETLSSSAQKQIQVVGDQIWMIGSSVQSGTLNIPGDIVLIKTDNEGNVTDDCFPIVDLTIESSVLTNNEEDVTLTAYTGVDNLAPQQPDVGDYYVIGKSECETDCNPEDCGSSFAYYYNAGQDAITTTVATDGTFYYLGGYMGTGGLVAKVDVYGNPQWVKQLFPTNGPSIVNDLTFDSDGMLIGCGRSSEGENAEAGFAFRINPLNGNLLWANRYTRFNRASYFYRIVEKGAGGVFVLFGGSEDSANNQDCDAAFLEVNRNTGALLPTQRQYNLGSCETFFDAMYDNGIFYTCGRYSFAGGGQDKYRAAVTSLNSDGTAIWSRMYLRDVVVNARMAAVDMVKDGTSLLFLAYGDENGTQVATNNIFLTRTSNVGTAMWGRRYVLPEAVIAQNLVVTPDGYLLLAYNTANTRQYLWKVDKLGAVQWTRSFENHRGYSFEGQSLLLETDHIILATGYLAAAEFPALLRLDPDGLPTDSCIPVGTPDITVQSITSPYDSFHQLTVYNAVFINPGFGAEDTNLELLDISCPLDCTEDEICDNGQDDDGDGLIDCDDPDLANDCCCYVSPLLSLGADTTLCPGETLLLDAGADFSVYTWSTGSTSQEIEVMQGGTYYVVVTDSCANELSDTVIINFYVPPVLDIGPDIVICNNGIFVLDAGAGFATYEWIDGSTLPTFTAYGAGTYWVTATDSCGVAQTDTVQISIDPATLIDLGPDTTLCMGASLTFSLSGFTDYQWYPADMVDCTTCPTVTFTPTHDTLLYVVAEFAPGCLSTDTLTVQVIDAIGTFASADLCVGATLTFGSQVIDQPGIYFDTLTASTGCNQIDTLAVSVFPALFTGDTLQICAGESVVIFGIPETEAGTYMATFTSSGNCDSTHTVLLEVNPLTTTAESLTLCAGDSILLFGNWETMAGMYAMTFSTASGCDSTHTVLVDVTQSITTLESLTLCIGDSVLLFGNWETMAGTYAMTFPTASSCDSTHTVSVDVTQAITTLESLTLCIGDSVLLFGNWETMAGTYAMTFPTASSCDSTHTVLVDVQPGVMTQEVRTICMGEVAMIFGESVTSPGIYLGEFSTPSGCDSIHQVELLVTTLAVSLPVDAELTFGDSLQIVPRITAGTPVAFDWSTSAGQFCESCPTLTVLPTETTTVQLTATDANGCTATDMMILTVNRTTDYYIPNAFSPNDDGLNDAFTIYGGAGLRLIRHLSIYDRWGDQVFSKDDLSPNQPREGWDGWCRGQPMNTGVYVYMAELELATGERIVVGGDLMLLRGE